MPRKTASGPSAVPLSQPEASSTVRSTTGAPYRRPLGADATRPPSLPGGGSAAGRAVSVPLTTDSIGTSARRPERGNEIFCQNLGAAAVVVVVADPPGAPFF